jgi:t-SNARE complex subunit (syntaxin)
MTFICGLILIHHRVLGKEVNRNFVLIRSNLTQNFAEQTFGLRIQTVAAIKGNEHENMHLVYEITRFMIAKKDVPSHENIINLSS